MTAAKSVVHATVSAKGYRTTASEQSCLQGVPHTDQMHRQKEQRSESNLRRISAVDLLLGLLGGDVGSPESPRFGHFAPAAAHCDRDGHNCGSREK
jgi:hypothetical protein